MTWNLRFGFTVRLVYRGSQALGVGEIYSGNITVPLGAIEVVLVPVVVFDVEIGDEVLFTEVVVVLMVVFDVECVDEVPLTDVVVRPVDLDLVLNDATAEADTPKNANKRESNMLKNRRYLFNEEVGGKS